MCNRIIKSISGSFGQVEKLSVKVVKVAPPINGNVDQVSVTMNWEKA